MGGAEGAVIQLPIVNGGGLRGEGAVIQLPIVNGRG